MINLTFCSSFCFRSGQLDHLSLQIIHGHLDLLDILFEVLPAEGVNLDFIFLGLHLDFVNLLKGVHGALECSFAFSNQIFEHASLFFFFLFLGIYDVFDFCFDPSTQGWRYSCLFSKFLKINF